MQAAEVRAHPPQSFFGGNGCCGGYGTAFAA